MVPKMVSIYANNDGLTHRRATVILRYSEGSSLERKGRLLPARSFGVPQDDDARNGATDH